MYLENVKETGQERICGRTKNA